MLIHDSDILRGIELMKIKVDEELTFRSKCYWDLIRADPVKANDHLAIYHKYKKAYDLIQQARELIYNS